MASRPGLKGRRPPAGRGFRRGGRGVVARVGASQARPAGGSDAVTISMLASATSEPGYDVLIPNFERAYPNITVNDTYASGNTVLYQLETTELAAATLPTCSRPTRAATRRYRCACSRRRDLAPMINKPWVKRSLPLATSLDKYGQGLFAFTPDVSPFAIFTNDGLFRQLG